MRASNHRQAPWTLSMEIKEKWINKKDIVYFNAKFYHDSSAEGHILIRVNQEVNKLELM